MGDTLCSTNPIVMASYAYDDNGNLTASPGFFDPVYDAQDRLLSTSATTFTNNAEGWRTGTTISVFNHKHTYHPTGHLLSTQGQQGTASYRLDPLGRRIERITSTQSSRFLFRDALRPAAELTTANALRSRFVYASGRNVPDFLWRDGSFFRIVTDPRGSVRMVVNVATGAVEQKMRHDAWGRVEEDTAPGWQPFGYAGGLYEPVTGTVRFGAREYDPTTARWMQKDPIRFEGGDSNLFAYVQNDPVNFVDWTGEKPGDVFSSPSRAAEDVLRFYWERSQRMSVEVGGLIYAVPGGGFAATWGAIGSANSVESGRTHFQIPAGGFPVGEYHTHGGCDKKYEGEDFSTRDKEHAWTSAFEPQTTELDRFGKQWLQTFGSHFAYGSFLATPSGAFKVFYPEYGKGYLNPKTGVPGLLLSLGENGYFQ